MKFSGFFSLLFIIFEITFIYSVKGQIFNREKTDCTKLYNFIIGNNKDYGNSCCSGHNVECDAEGYITELTLG